jgi:glycosyl hydrolase family 9/concanavalin A-like lectin/glucanase superfamily protein/cellulase-like Ig domain-containing protein
MMGKNWCAVTAALVLGVCELTAASVVDYTDLVLPRPGEHTLHILSPTVLELVLINSKAPDPAHVDSWDLVDVNSQFQAPPPSAFLVTAGGQQIAVQAVGFKRRPLYAPSWKRDLRIQNAIALRLGSAIVDGQTVEVRNPTGTLWGAEKQFVAVAEPNRYSPAIHVNQHGYAPNLPKRAMVGYYVGNLGELAINSGVGFRLVDAGSGAQVHNGTLTLRRDVGFEYLPTPYQNVYEANFTSFNTPGFYRLVVPGMGSSLPFRIHDGVPMAFTRAYALGLYHQRCGTDNRFPFTRHIHNHCHTNLADVPVPESSFPFTWSEIAKRSADYTNNPRHTAVQLRSEATQLYPYVNRARLNVAGGHHDAGDYSKYTANSAGLIHLLLFAVDCFPGVAALDNLGIPESGDGISDLLQEAKWETDFLAKLQDADGGFYFLVYPRDRAYENNVLPDAGDPQVVWPKTTAVTASGVAALAQAASSPLFKQRYPAEAASYLQKAHLGWNFLTNAIARFGKDGSYQKITHYGDSSMHDDELAWAACQMYLATTNVAYQQKLIEWYDPQDPATRRYGWMRLFDAYGRAARSYAFGARSGRVAAGHLDATYRAKCDTELLAAAQELAQRATNNAYGVSFPFEDKSYRTAGWFFPSARAFDLTVAYQMDPRPEYLDAIISNFNYEGGCNPLNVSFMTGLGWKRQREMVHQYALNDRRVLPPSGLPLGAMQSSFDWLGQYGSELGALVFPTDWFVTGPYAFYDRWADTWNVTTEFVVTDQSAALGSLAFVAALGPLTSQSWVSATAQIVVPAQAAMNLPATASVQASGFDLSQAQVVWEGRDQEPAFGTNYVFVPKTLGTMWIEVEATLPDGRRVFASTNITVINGPPAVTVTASDPTASESGDPGVFTFSRTSSNTAVTVFFTLSGSATSGTHFANIGNSVSMPIGAGTRTVTISPINNAVADGNKTVILSLATNVSYAVSSPTQAVVTIYDDELNVVPSVNISSPSATTIHLQNTNNWLSVQATASDDGKPVPPGSLALNWNQVSGPGTLTFSPSNSANCLIKFNAPGIYTLRLSAYDGQYQASDEFTAVVDPDFAVSSGLVAYWRFAESFGTGTADSSGNNRNAIISGGATFGAGRLNNALNFDGFDDVATFTSPELNQISVVGWLRMEGNGNNVFTPRVVAMPGFAVRPQRDAVNGHRLTFQSERSESVAEWRTDLGTLTDNVWIHFACVYNPYQPGAVPEIYLNGVAQNVTELGFGTGSLIPNAGTGYIGNSGARDRGFDGSIDELRIYNRLLTAEEVRLLAYVSVGNLAPLVNVGNDVSFFTNPFTIRAVVSDDGKPLPVTNYWRQVSGPGTVTIANTNARTTTATFPTPGSYVLRFYATDGEVMTHDEVQCTFLPPPEITSITQVGNVVTIGWTSVVGKNYRVHYKNSLSDPTWTVLVGPIVATSTVTSSVITNTVSPRFYRVSAQ